MSTDGEWRGGGTGTQRVSIRSYHPSRVPWQPAGGLQRPLRRDLERPRRRFRPRSGRPAARRASERESGALTSTDDDEVVRVLRSRESALCDPGADDGPRRGGAGERLQAKGNAPTVSGDRSARSGRLGVRGTS